MNVFRLIPPEDTLDLSFQKITQTVRIAKYNDDTRNTLTAEQNGTKNNKLIGKDTELALSHISITWLIYCTKIKWNAETRIPILVTHVFVVLKAVLFDCLECVGQLLL